MAEVHLPEPFLVALQSLAEWLKAEGVPYTAIGGIAVSLIAQPRATQDIDACIWLAEDRWAALLASGAEHGFVPRISDALEFAQQARVLLLKDQRSGTSIDISCGALEFEREMIDRATTLEIGALVLKVPTPEDLIVTKAVAQRAKDIADIESIVSVQKNLDVNRIRRWLNEFAAALEMPEIKESVEGILLRHHQPKRELRKSSPRRPGKRPKN